MLFDLRGRHRRRAVKVLYVGLALLIGGGLILFGVGAGTGGGGLLNAATENESSGGASFSSQIKKYEKTLQKDPKNVAAWEKLTLAELHESGGEAFTNATTGAPTAKGKELFAKASRSWESYLAQNPPKPSTELAKLMLRVYGAEGLNEPASAVQVLQLVVAAEPNSAAYYAQLAEYAYKAKNARVGDLASAKAVSLAPSTDRTRIKQELEAVKKSPEGGQTFTTTTNGTVYTGKANSSGGFQGTAVTTTPQPSTSTGKTTSTSTTPAAKSK
ncbi:MAG TPA: hypothetical protein VH081_11700 [Solirubrobacteraceae bacterium]|jgi:hypothetical protein|nr:hypothetical protein [Solirubrobacteraceae bacterium]